MSAVARWLIAAWLAAYGSPPAMAATAARKAVLAPREVRIPDSIVHTLVSKRNGVAYRLTILLPSDYATDRRPHGVVYVMDGDWLAPVVRSSLFLADRAFRSFIVVGVDSDDPDHHWQDMPTAGHDRHWDVRPDRGAANFLDIMRREIKPYVDARFRTAEDTGIVGHSLGGFFALYAGLHAPELFHHVVAFSPSLVWQDNILAREQRDASSGLADLPVRFYVDVGGLEPQGGRVDDLARALLSHGYPSLRWTNRVIPDQTHSSVAAADAVDALRAVYDPEPRVVGEAELMRLAGRYAMADGTSLTLQPQGDHLVMVLPDFDDDPVRLLSTRPGVFFVKGLDTRLEFELAGTHGVDLMLFKQPTPGPGGADVLPQLRGTKVLPGRPTSAMMPDR